MGRLYPSVRHVLLLALLAFPFAQFAVFSFVSAYSERLGLLAAELTILWIVSLSIRHYRWCAEDLLLLNATSWRALVGAAVAGVGASLLIAEFDLLFGRLAAAWDLGLPLSLQRGLIQLQLLAHVRELPLALAAVALAPGVCEEVFFRGFLLTALIVHRGAAMGIIGSALLFAGVHFNPWQFPALFLFGLFLALIVWYTHSLYPAMLAHILNNLLSLAGVNARTYLDMDVLATNEPLHPAMVVAAALLLWLGFRLVRRTAPLVPFAPRLDTLPLPSIPPEPQLQHPSGQH